jgi:hypothetical protein
MLHTTLVALALLATTLMAAGCGGSSKAGETSTSAATTPTTTAAGTTAAANTAPVPTVTVKIASGKPLTRAQWIAKGDAICARLNRELDAISVKTAAELPRVLPQEAAYERAEVAQLATLVSPASSAKDWQEFLNATLQWAEGSAKLAEYGRFGDAITRTPLAATVIGIHEHVMKIAKRNGFRACSSA